MNDLRCAVSQLPDITRKWHAAVHLPSLNSHCKFGPAVLFNWTWVSRRESQHHDNHSRSQVITVSFRQYASSALRSTCGCPSSERHGRY